MLKKYEKKEDIPEAFQEHYQERNGKWVPVMEGDDALRSALDSERTRANQMQSELSALKSKWADLDPDEVRRKLEDAGKGKGAGNAELESLRQTHQEELRLRDEKVRKANQQLDDTLIEMHARASMPAGASAELLLPHIKPSLKVFRDDAGGTPAVKVVDQYGNPRSSGKEGAGEMQVGELLAGMAKDSRYAGAFPAGGAGGSGNQGGESAGSAGSGSHSISRADARDPGKYQRARATAEKAGAELTIEE